MPIGIVCDVNEQDDRRLATGGKENVVRILDLNRLDEEVMLPQSDV